MAEIRLADLGMRTLEPSGMRARSHRPTEAVNLTLQATFARWLGRAPEQEQAERLYAALSTQARAPMLFAEFGVPDTLDGRFDALCLHMFLLVRRLGRDPQAEGIARGLYDCMFKDMDATLRELGVGDLGVGRRVRQMAEGLMGRIKAYGAALDSPDSELLDAAVRRNLLGTVDAPQAAAVTALCRYVRASDAQLTAQPIAELLAHGPRFAAGAAA